MDSGNRRAIYAALSANMGIAILKFIGFFVTGASSMLAESVHSMADTGNQALLLWGGAAAARAPSSSHPFGYGRERYFWSFVVALILFSLGSLFAIYEGIHKLQHPEPLNQLGVAIAILIAGLVLEGFSFRMAVREGARIKGNAGWWSFIRKTKNPELPVVILEDFGALLGLLIALGGLMLAASTGDARFDAAGTITIGLLLGGIAVVLAIEMKSLLIGEGASDADREHFVRAIEAGDDVHRVINMKTQHIGPEQVLLAAKVEFVSSLSFAELTESIDAAEARVREGSSLAEIWIYLEPDIYDPEHPGASQAPPDPPPH